MDKKTMYTSVSKKHIPTTHKVKNGFIAFVSGGTLAVFSQMFYELIQVNTQLTKAESISAVIIGLILISAISTGLGVYDKIACVCGAGLFIPITGFANALTSCALESKNEGFIFGIGSNMFKLAGSVITYGIVSAYILGMIRYVIALW